MSAIARSIFRNAAGLGLFAVITGGTIALTHELTRDRIAAQAARAEASALFEIFPERSHDNNLLEDRVTLPAGKPPDKGEPVTARVARRNGEVIGLIVPTVAPDGYSGEIHLLVGLDLQGEILGVRVTSHRETPGLGDRIETRKSDWIHDFEGKSLGNPPPDQWNVKKNGGVFDQFTGATITPRAVTKAVQHTLTWFRQNRQAILSSLQSNRESG